MSSPKRAPSQVVGNAGLYYVAYRLSMQRWNVMPTSRNARGVDIVLLSEDAKMRRTIQVKALSRRNPVGFGGSLDNLLADFVVVCTNLATESPECFVIEESVARKLARRFTSKKTGEVSHWLDPADWHQERFRDAWSVIGSPGAR